MLFSDNSLQKKIRYFVKNSGNKEKVNGSISEQTGWVHSIFVAFVAYATSKKELAVCPVLRDIFVRTYLCAFKGPNTPIEMFTLNCKGRLLTIFHDDPLVMGILNITPDSFFSGSRLSSVDAALQQAETMLRDGAAILDVGGQSTRPDSRLINTDEELSRVIPVIKNIRKQFPHCFISIDTFYAVVAMQAIEAGADIVNDISCGETDSNMIATVADLKVPYVAMHMRGTPATMQQFTQYENVTREVVDYFIKKIEDCRLRGINDVIIDPGFGFAKTIQQNFQLLQELSVLKMLNKPILLGVSRKSMIYKTLNTTPETSLNGTGVLNTIGVLHGANILRVHDVKEAKEVIRLTKATNAGAD